MASLLGRAKFELVILQTASSCGNLTGPLIDWTRSHVPRRTASIALPSFEFRLIKHSQNFLPALDPSALFAFNLLKLET